ncbi:MAG: hypothetical protein RL266_1493, partial [Bacteroidota bacterium]
MKNILLSVSALLIVLNVVAQVDFPTDNAVWVNTHYTYTFNPPNPIPFAELTHVDNYCVSGEDTTISGNDYTKVFYCADGYKGALREINSAVFFVPADSTDEYLLYDFAAQQGQALNNVFVGNHFGEDFMLQDFTVQQVGTEVIGGITRRVVWADSYRWIEGIGCQTGLFMEPWPNVSMYEVRLECFSLDGQMIFPTEGNDPCPFLFVGVNDKESQVVVNAYPNPTNHAITIEFGTPQKLVNVSVVNCLGQEVEQLSTTNTSNIQLNLESPSGIYFALVTLENGQHSTL